MPLERGFMGYTQDLDKEEKLKLTAKKRVEVLKSYIDCQITDLNDIRDSCMYVTGKMDAGIKDFPRLHELFTTYEEIGKDILKEVQVIKDS